MKKVFIVLLNCIFIINCFGSARISLLSSDSGDENISDIKVKSQADVDGGGSASCAYHALKNGICISKALLEETDNKDSKIDGLVKDTLLIKNLFGNNEAPWRSIIILNRNIKYISQWIYNQLIQLLDGLKLVKTENVEIEKTLHFNNVVVYFDAYTSKERRNGYCKEERKAVINILTDVAILCAKELLTQSAIVSNSRIKDILVNVKKLKYPNLLPDLEKKIGIYFKPEFDLISYSHLSGIVNLMMNKDLLQIAEEKCYYYNYAKEAKISDISSTSTTGLLGEWLDANELLKLLNEERTASKPGSIWSNLGDIKVAIIHDRSSFEDQLYNNEVFGEIVLDTKNETKKTISILLININGNHWISCVIETNPTKPIKYYFADSLGDSFSMYKKKELIRTINNNHNYIEAFKSLPEIFKSTPKINETLMLYLEDARKPEINLINISTKDESKKDSENSTDQHNTKNMPNGDYSKNPYKRKYDDTVFSDINNDPKDQAAEKIESIQKKIKLNIEALKEQNKKIEGFNAFGLYQTLAANDLDVVRTAQIINIVQQGQKEQVIKNNLLIKTYSSLL